MNEKLRKQTEANVRCILGDMSDLKKRALAEMGKLFPIGMRVEVKLKHGQINWTPATVTGRMIQSGYAVDYHPTILVEIDTAKPNSRLRYRDIVLDNIRPLGAAQ